MISPVYVPRWGVTMEEATVVAWLAEEGAPVAKGQDLVELETEKMVNLVECPGDGVLRTILAAEGERVRVGAVIGVVAGAQEPFDLEALLQAAASPEGDASRVRKERPRAPAGRTASGRVRASPAARRLAEELGVEIAGVEGSGPEGSIGREDVLRVADDAVAASRQERFVVVEGVRLRCVLVGGVGCGLPRSRPPVVLVHGVAGSLDLWQANVGALARRHVVVALDLPGHGGSDKPPAQYGVEFLSRMTAGFLRELGMGSVVLVGHSLGGHVCLRVAVDEPALVAGLVLVDAGGLGEEIDVGFVQGILQAPPTREAVESLLNGLFQDRRWVTRPMVDLMREHLSAPGALDAVRAAVAATVTGTSQRESLAHRLRDLSVPLLVVWGEGDRVVPLEQGRNAAAQAKRGEFWMAPAAGHCPQVEAAPSFNARLQEFLSGFPDGR